jgi:hypothetical protein
VATALRQDRQTSHRGSPALIARRSVPYLYYAPFLEKWRTSPLGSAPV